VSQRESWMKKMRERDIEKRFVDEVKKIGGRCAKWVSPGWSGVPDRIVLMPGGKMYFVELKAPGETERALQTRRQAQLREMGFTVYGSVDSFEKIEKIIKEILTSQT